MVESDKWKIYGLVCPVSKKIRYVGKSSNYKTRYKQHLADIGDETYKKMWISSLKSKGLIPELVILDTASTEIEGRYAENKAVLANISTVYNIFMPAKLAPTCHDYRIKNNIMFDCEFDSKKLASDKYNKSK